MTDGPEPKSAQLNLLQSAAIIVRDLCGVAGIAALTYGVAQIYVPAAWIVGGALTTGICILLARGQRS